MTNSKAKIKKVKAWAVVFDGHFSEIIENNNGLAIFPNYSDAKRTKDISELLKILPCTIVYSLPSKKKK